MRQCRIDPAVRHLLDCVHILILKLADFADLSEDFTVRSSHERGEHEGQGLDDWIPQWRNCRVWQDRSFRLVRRVKSSGPGHVTAVLSPFRFNYAMCQTANRSPTGSLVGVNKRMLRRI